jgi:hypothetical protein
MGPVRMRPPILGAVRAHRQEKVGCQELSSRSTGTPPSRCTDRFDGRSNTASPAVSSTSITGCRARGSWRSISRYPATRSTSPIRSWSPKATCEATNVPACSSIPRCSMPRHRKRARLSRVSTGRAGSGDSPTQAYRRSRRPATGTGTPIRSWPARSTAAASLRAPGSVACETRSISRTPTRVFRTVWPPTTRC